MNQRKKAPVVLIVLDGWGVAQPSETNAVHLARTPVMDALCSTYPQSRLNACGEAVGLPEGQMGNSEVGHLNLGAGRIVYQDFTRITKAIREGEFQKNTALRQAMEAVRSKGTSLHLMGLVSDGGVHSHTDHLFALVNMAREMGCPSLQIHAFLDGRDTPPTSGIHYVQKVDAFLREAKLGRIATVMGRYWGMDRDQRWDRVERAFRAFVMGEGRVAASAVASVQYGYDRGQTDEFLEPAVIIDGGEGSGGCIRDGDGVVFFNFRADRAREITRALTDPAFGEFRRPRVPKLSAYICMTQYDETFQLPVAFPQVRLSRIFGEVIADAGVRQLRIAETEKYAHVTFFFNGGEEKPFPLEDRCLIPSPKEIPTYDLKPEMSAPKVAQEVVQRIRQGIYGAIILNFANGDMVGHTGVLSAAIHACEVVDKCVGRVVEAVLDSEGVALITSDHGNAEQMEDEQTRGPHTAHSCSPVPCILVHPRRKRASLREGILADVAPTLLEIMGISTPDEMTGRSLLEG